MLCLWNREETIKASECGVEDKIWIKPTWRGQERSHLALEDQWKTERVLREKKCAICPAVWAVISHLSTTVLIMRWQAEALHLVTCCVLNHSAICSQFLEMYPKCLAVTLSFSFRYLFEAIQLCVEISYSLFLTFVTGWQELFILWILLTWSHSKAVVLSSKMACVLQAAQGGVALSFLPLLQHWNAIGSWSGLRHSHLGCHLTCSMEVATGTRNFPLTSWTLYCNEVRSWASFQRETGMRSRTFSGRFSREASSSLAEVRKMFLAWQLCNICSAL